MDGARMLRSGLAFFLSRLIATRFVAGLSWLAGSALIVAGIFTPRLWGFGLSIGLVLFGAMGGRAGEDFAAVGGHLFRGVVTVTCEAQIVLHAGAIRRSRRPDLGFNPLELPD